MTIDINLVVDEYLMFILALITCFLAAFPVVLFWIKTIPRASFNNQRIPGGHIATGMITAQKDRGRAVSLVAICCSEELGGIQPTEGYPVPNRGTKMEKRIPLTDVKIGPHSTFQMALNVQGPPETPVEGYISKEKDGRVIRISPKK